MYLPFNAGILATLRQAVGVAVRAVADPGMLLTVEVRHVPSRDATDIEATWLPLPQYAPKQGRLPDGRVTACYRVDGALLALLRDEHEAQRFAAEIATALIAHAVHLPEPTPPERPKQDGSRRARTKDEITRDMQAAVEAMARGGYYPRYDDYLPRKTYRAETYPPAPPAEPCNAVTPDVTPVTPLQTPPTAQEQTTATSDLLADPEFAALATRLEAQHKHPTKPATTARCGGCATPTESLTLGDDGVLRCPACDAHAWAAAHPEAQPSRRGAPAAKVRVRTQYDATGRPVTVYETWDPVTGTWVVTSRSAAPSTEIVEVTDLAGRKYAQFATPQELTWTVTLTE